MNKMENKIYFIEFNYVNKLILYIFFLPSRK